jgi:hypothetical protein
MRIGNTQRQLTAGNKRSRTESSQPDCEGTGCQAFALASREDPAAALKAVKEVRGHNNLNIKSI